MNEKVAVQYVQVEELHACSQAESHTHAAGQAK